MFAGKQLTLTEAERLCRWYFRAGFAGLPLLWFLVWITFRHRADASEAIAWYTGTALWLSIIAGLLLIVWYVAALLLLPRSSSLFVIPPFTGVWQSGYYAL
ncbi:Gamma-secretase aspartyl protease complex [Trypanosoma melophagium]|uniref:Gamma-secretase aspartyl protease complex n=1 Tax=Trypanosoma melophagium TaxID=715481 RepID=UPI00351A9F9C|nr:Gamma-secretase aspartyl protease complex [Trypanosoma melophagium]